MTAVTPSCLNCGLRNGCIFDGLLHLNVFDDDSNHQLKEKVDNDEHVGTEEDGDQPRSGTASIVLCARVK